MRSEKLMPHHLRAIMPFLQEKQYDFSYLPVELIESVGQHGPGIAVMDGDKILACIGIIDLPGTHRAVVWGVFAAVIRGSSASLFKIGMKFLGQNRRRRLEAHIDPDFPASIRLASMCGFTLEGTMKCFTENGDDRQLWARVEA